jgi:RecA-family ATPase
MDKISPEEIVNLSKPTNDETKSFVKMDTIVMAKEGQSISGDEIIRMIEESKKTDISIAKLAQKLNADVKTYISPGVSVPEMEHRSKRKR